MLDWAEANSASVIAMDRKAMVESDAWEGPAFQTCRNVAAVCAVYQTSRRRDVLSFSHHEACASLPHEEADKVLDWAEANGASVKAVADGIGWSREAVKDYAALQRIEARLVSS